MADEQRFQTKKLGLALGGGGARALAHIGVLKVLENAGLRIDLIAGTSMGGLIGLAFAAGATAERLEKEALDRTTRRKLVNLVDLAPSSRGLVRGSRIYRLTGTITSYQA